MERFKNQNVNETDYDKQFKEDLEKATALSLETLALEQFHRNKSQHGGSVTDGPTVSGAMKFSTCKYTTIDTNIGMKLMKRFLSMILAQSNLSSVSIKSNQLMTRPRPGSFGNSPSTSFNSGKSFPTSSSSGSLAPPPSTTQRNPNRNQSKTNEYDLISFSNPTENIDNDESLLLTSDSALATTATSPANEAHSNFKQMVDEIHRYSFIYQ